MDDSLYELIKNIQNGDNEKFLDIIMRFEPLIDKLVRKLMHDEAKTDLIIAFIEMVKTINLNNFTPKDEGKIVNYINRVMKNKHVDFFRKYVQRHKEEIEINLDITLASEEFNIESNIFIEDLLYQLPRMQKIILKEKYIKDCSDIEIAEKLHISRQAVNKAKNAAIGKLRIYLETDFISV